MFFCNLRKSVENVIDGLREVSSGDLCSVLRAEHNDEFGEIIKYVNKMSEKICGMTAEIKRVANNVGEASDMMSTTVEQSSQAAQSVVESALPVKKGLVVMRIFAFRGQGGGCFCKQGGSRCPRLKPDRIPIIRRCR